MHFNRDSHLYHQEPDQETKEHHVAQNNPPCAPSSHHLVGKHRLDHFPILYRENHTVQTFCICGFFNPTWFFGESLFMLSE